MSGFIEAQVWYKCFQSAHGSKCQHLPVSYCPSLGLVSAPCVPTVSQSVLLPSLFQALWFRDEQGWDFYNVLLSHSALPSPLETQLILIFSDMLSWWQYSVVRLHLVCFLFTSFSNLMRAMRHQDKMWQNVWTNSSKPMWLSGKMLRSHYFWLLHCALTSYH